MTHPNFHIAFYAGGSVDGRDRWESSWVIVQKLLVCVHRCVSVIRVKCTQTILRARTSVRSL